MKKHIFGLARICASVAALAICAPAQAQTVQNNTIGPSLQFGGGQTNFGIDSKFGVSDNLSVRPFIYFPSGGTDFGTALTYDFQLPTTGNNLQVTPFVGGAVDINNTNGSGTTTASIVGGADLNLTDNIQAKIGLAIPLSTDSGQSTAVTLGAGLRF
jgi:hemolysin activation/secretion protein